MLGRITSEYIKELKTDQVFVFGSNKIGKHGKGAAKIALKFGAKPGVGVGLMGNSYGIPTKGSSMYKSLDIGEIKRYVDVFILFARDNPGKTFLVTQIGCGLAGFTPKQIGPLFIGCEELSNVHLPLSFWKKLKY